MVSLLLFFSLGTQVAVLGATVEPRVSDFSYGHRFDGAAIGTLQVDDLILTAYNPNEGVVGMSFRLDGGTQEPVGLLFDEGKNYITDFQVVESQGTLNRTKNRYVYKGEIDGIQYNKAYHYVIQSGEAYSDYYRFHGIDSEKPTVIGFFGDAQGYKMSQYERLRTTYDLASEIAGTIDIAYLAGDIVDTGDAFNQWGYFYKAMADKLSTSLWLSVIGNHDVKNDDSLYTDAFNYPNNGVPGLEERNFYVDIPYGRIAIIDTESFKTYAQQQLWLKETMAPVQDRFRIVLMHRSVYPISYDEGFVRKFSKTFDEAGIDLVLSGHDHIYSRTTLREQKKVEEGYGTTYIVGGSPSGSKYYNEKNSSHRYWKQVVYDENKPVFSLVEIGKESIHINAYSVTKGKAEIIDTLSIDRK